MGMYAIYRCIKCRKHIATLNPNVLVGEPFLTCQYCGQIHNISDDRNEYDLMLGRMKLRVKAILWIQTGLLGTVVPIALLAWTVPFRDLSVLPVIALLAVGWFVAYWIFSFFLSKQIQESRKRLANPAYVSFLTQIGLMKS